MLAKELKDKTEIVIYVINRIGQPLQNMSQMTTCTDIFHLSQALPSPFLIHDLLPVL